MSKHIEWDGRCPCCGSTEIDSDPELVFSMECMDCNKYFFVGYILLQPSKSQKDLDCQ